MQRNQLENFVSSVAILESTNVSSVGYHTVESNAKILMKKHAASNGIFDFEFIYTDKPSLLNRITV